MNEDFDYNLESLILLGLLAEAEIIIKNGEGKLDSISETAYEIVRRSIEKN